MLRTILTTLVIVLVTATCIYAAPQGNSKKTRTSELQAFMMQSLQEGISPTEMMRIALEDPKNNPQDIIAAMYLTRIPESDIKEAAQANGISDAIVLAGYKQALDEDPELAQAYTPINPAQRRFAVENVTAYGILERNREILTQSISPSTP